MKTVLVTGYATNIGKSITEVFLSNGCNIIGIFGPGTEEYDRLMRQKHSNIISYFADFTSEDSMDSLINQLRQHHYDVIVNNAGMVNLNQDGTICNEFLAFNYSKFTDVMRCNFDAPLRICLELKDRINIGGSIINIASGGGMRASYGTISYAASKAALINLTMSLSNQFYSFNQVRVNSVSPGWVNPTDISKMGVDLETNSPGAKAARLTAMGRNATPQEIAKVVFFLTTDDASFINGSNIVVDGGWLNHNVIYMEEATGEALIQ